VDVLVEPQSSGYSRSQRPILAFARAAALVTLGIGVGVLSGLPVSGSTASAMTLVSVALGCAGALTMFLRPDHPVAVGAADVLLGSALLASAFDRVGFLYLPSLLAFLAVTARTSRPPDPIAEDEGEAPGPAARAVLARWAASRRREPGRHRAPGRPRRAAGAVPGGWRTLGEQESARIAWVRTQPVHDSWSVPVGAAQGDERSEGSIDEAVKAGAVTDGDHQHTGQT
jgi:hypothetical protein